MDSYNSKYPLEYYEIGTPYMFYTVNLPIKGEPATEAQILSHEKELEESSTQKCGKFGTAERCIGVVVGKESFDGSVLTVEDADGKVTKETAPEIKTPYTQIVVMFRATIDDNEGYVTIKYVTNYSGVFFDDKENVPAGGFVDLTGKIDIGKLGKGEGGTDDIGRRDKDGNGDDLGRRKKQGEGDDLGRREKKK